MKSKRRSTRSPPTADTKTTPTGETTGASVFSSSPSSSMRGGEVNNSQGDNVRETTVIIHNHYGGSNLDTSRASLTVSEASRSGSVVNTPSGQEESEKLSVCTDSGYGGSDVSSEIESPPPEEENSVEEELSNAIYKRHMYLKKHGEPLFIPQPNIRLPLSYRQQGVSPGDVGIFTPDGGFDYLFNIFLPAGHPNNPDTLPAGFSPLEPADISEFRAHSSHSHMISPSVRKQGAKFECFGSDGAILTMPQGAYHEDLRNISRVRDYAFIHAESWYEYANGPCSRGIDKKELHVVTGCDKTTSWGIATYSHLQSERFEDRVTRLSFNVSNEGRQPTYSWDYEGTAEAKAGPEDEELVDPPEGHGSAPLRNQCTFVRSLTVALGDDAWKRVKLKMAASAEARSSAQPSRKNTFASVLGAISSLQGIIGSLHDHSGVGTSGLSDSATPAQTPAAHVADMLLQKCPRAKVVVVHSSDWCSVIRDSDYDWMSTFEDLQHRVQEAFDIVEEENGTVYLQEKMRSSQQPNTPSHVSIELEDEDLSILGGRKYGFLQSFESFEITPSDARADSPSRSFRKLLDDWNDDIKPNIHHDSGELSDQYADPGQSPPMGEESPIEEETSNAIHERDIDPSNPDELPEGFSRLDLEPVDVLKFHAHASLSHIASPSVSAVLSAVKRGIAHDTSLGRHRLGRTSNVAAYASDGCPMTTRLLHHSGSNSKKFVVRRPDVSSVRIMKMFEVLANRPSIQHCHIAPEQVIDGSGGPPDRLDFEDAILFVVRPQKHGLTDSMAPVQTQANHPATPIINMLLQTVCPRARVVTVDDRDWCSVIQDSDKIWMTTAPDLLRRIQEAFDVVEEENGSVYLQEKMRSYHILVQLEDENLPPLGELKPGVLQPFHSFGVSPSDIKADSPPRTLNNSGAEWNDEIKPNIYYDPDDDYDLDGEDDPVRKYTERAKLKVQVMDARNKIPGVEQPDSIRATARYRVNTICQKYFAYQRVFGTGPYQPMACIKCHDRKIKCFSGEECHYPSIAERTQHTSRTPPDPTDVYPP